MIDHRILARPTTSGGTAILSMADLFSNYVYLEVVTDTKAITTAKAIMKRIVPGHPEFKAIVSDRGSGFKSKIIKYFSEMLGLTHFFSSSLNPRGHGIIENVNKQINSLIPKMVENDTMIEAALPLIERVLNCTVPATQAYSPYQIMRGQLPRMHLNGVILGEETPIQSK